MSKLRVLIGISIAAMFAITAAQARPHHTYHAVKYHAVKAKKAEPCKAYGDSDLPQMCSTH